MAATPLFSSFVSPPRAVRGLDCFSQQCSLRSLVPLPFTTIPTTLKYSAVPVRATSADTVVEYGKKELISLTRPLHDYILQNIREPEVLRELREETMATMKGEETSVSPDQAQLLSMLVQIHGAKNCIEVGVFNGYSSLAIALALPEEGRLVACERDAQCVEFAKRYYKRAAVAHKVDLRHGLAVDALNSLLENGEFDRYDFAFVDADKVMYPTYYEMLLKLVRTGGLIVLDDVLWSGKVADPSANDEITNSIRELNKNIFQDKRVNISMVPIGTGMTICRKL
ncbi:probable caffeoyl-CoA O-methyltransferase At4g26220 [Aristolochia californica]|uniref:probable caffeoyl-CoA O-methyltransferase At4g26220 n=1 Tax=Aristolochia californica TaxID=171875 RepID=UPI0035D8460A